MVDVSIAGNLYKEDTRRCRTVREDWRLLKNYVVKMSSLRNEIAHGTMMNYDNKEMMITPYATSIPFRDGISISEVNNRAQLFIELDSALKWHELAFAALWKTKLRRLVLNQQPTPDLVLRLRKQAAQGRKAKKAQQNTSRRKR
jgi:hypothetical protein